MDTTTRIIAALTDSRDLRTDLFLIAETVAQYGTPEDVQDVTCDEEWGVGLVETIMGTHEIRQALKKLPRARARVFWKVRRELKSLMLAA
jgi:hypothetical protein